MDLGTVETKLDENAYADARALLADVRLVFDNAMLYNPADHAVHKCRPCPPCPACAARRTGGSAGTLTTVHGERECMFAGSCAVTSVH
jgi:hypothetical protein